MPQLPEAIKIYVDTLRDRLDAGSVVDISLIALLIFAALVWLKGTSGMSLVRGAAFLIILGIVFAGLIDLPVVRWVLRNSVPALLVIVPIVFQQEIRRGLERVGRTRVATRRNRRATEPTLAALSEAAVSLSASRIGALIVVERETGLDDYIRSGVLIDAIPTKELVINVFWRNSPLHDGAMVVRESRVIAAGCTLPLSEAPLPGHMGTRHRAALGISERTDAVVLVVSEETGAISLVVNGQFLAGLDPDRMRRELHHLAGQTEGAPLRLVRAGERGAAPAEAEVAAGPRQARRH